MYCQSHLYLPLPPSQHFIRKVYSPRHEHYFKEPFMENKICDYRFTNGKIIKNESELLLSSFSLDGGI
jgi:hypothetical protein